MSGFSLTLDGRDAFRNLLTRGLMGVVAFLSAITLVRKSWSDFYLWVLTGYATKQNQTRYGESTVFNF